MHGTLKAEDQIAGSVTVSGTKYTLAITDHTHPSGTLTFTGASATSGTATGTISGSPHDAIIAVDGSGKTDASVSKLADNGAAFSDTWRRSQ